ncbi:uncharacterized protein EV420DRAFT_1691363 [Desarmillaria tabescens]|uniref:Uncharacterized protein n=1 Tax=Armillaria tabescens TaxID=1929756 RepID=A0AA39KA68_ARMTA|nr:uncharacterized protein EV420DRAFT_1691363 [Desarmillaria tabescens]KAK0457103.1 hypothetical protein EV420DRAFT_1691363 [Desarmillaria tabescens]
MTLYWTCNTGLLVKETHFSVLWTMVYTSPRPEQSLQDESIRLFINGKLDGIQTLSGPWELHYDTQNSRAAFYHFRLMLAKPVSLFLAMYARGLELFKEGSITISTYSNQMVIPSLFRGRDHAVEVFAVLDGDIKTMANFREKSSVYRRILVQASLRQCINLHIAASRVRGRRSYLWTSRIAIRNRFKDTMSQKKASARLSWGSPIAGCTEASKRPCIYPCQDAEKELSIASKVIVSKQQTPASIESDALSMCQIYLIYLSADQNLAATRYIAESSAICSFCGASFYREGCTCPYMVPGGSRIICSSCQRYPQRVNLLLSDPVVVKTSGNRIDLDVSREYNERPFGAHAVFWGNIDKMGTASEFGQTRPARCGLSWPRRR